MMVKCCPRCNSLNFRATKNGSEARHGADGHLFFCEWCGLKFSFAGTLEVAGPPPSAKQPRPKPDPPWWEIIEQHD